MHIHGACHREDKDDGIEYKLHRHVHAGQAADTLWRVVDAKVEFVVIQRKRCGSSAGDSILPQASASLHRQKSEQPSENDLVPIVKGIYTTSRVSRLAGFQSLITYRTLMSRAGNMLKGIEIPNLIAIEKACPALRKRDVRKKIHPLPTHPPSQRGREVCKSNHGDSQRCIISNQKE